MIRVSNYEIIRSSDNLTIRSSSSVEGDSNLACWFSRCYRNWLQSRERQLYFWSYLNKHSLQWRRIGESLISTSLAKEDMVTLSCATYQEGNWHLTSNKERRDKIGCENRIGAPQAHGDRLFTWGPHSYSPAQSSILITMQRLLYKKPLERFCLVIHNIVEKW